VALEVVRSATSVERSVTSPATVLKAADMVAVAVAVATVEGMEVATAAEAEAVGLEDRRATLVEAMATCLATVPKVRNVTIAAKSVTYRAIALPSLHPNASAISASNQDTSRLHAQPELPGLILSCWTMDDPRRCVRHH